MVLVGRFEPKPWYYMSGLSFEFHSFAVFDISLLQSTERQTTNDFSGTFLLKSITQTIKAIVFF